MRVLCLFGKRRADGNLVNDDDKVDEREDVRDDIALYLLVATLADALDAPLMLVPPPVVVLATAGAALRICSSITNVMMDDVTN